MARICSEVIDSMVAIIPEDEILFIEVLGKAREDCEHESLEDVAQWQRLALVVNGFLPFPSQDWQYKVLSVFTTLPVEQIKAQSEEDRLSMGAPVNNPE